MKIALLQTGKTTDKNIEVLADVYAGRIRKYNVFEILTVQDIKNSKNMPVAELQTKEATKILQNISTDDFVILLDERGKEFRTKEFSAYLEKVFFLPKKRILFIIGGAWGFSDDIYKRADYKISLSKMTFPHQLVRLLFLEQLYRVFTIMKGEPYHHD